ncbi:MAG: CBS domain-containing protein [Phycisphaerales bacterium]|nr:MAG: CBS domain-containing protein [Phycisphaerales bacterium]
MPVKVRDILAKKAQEVASVSQDATVAEAAHLMNQRRIGALVVTSGPRVVGIFTERDILCRVVAEHRDAAQTRVHEVMTAPVACCQSDTELEECRAVMTTRRMRHLPVVDDNRLVGMLSIGDIMAHEAAAQQETIKYLNEYLYGPTR